jgi:hypothetical protein
VVLDLDVKSERRRLLERIPILKLPAEKLEPCLGAMRASKSELRRKIVEKILADVYPTFDEKRAFRALVAPTLTRLHFARSQPPFFRWAPNGRIWRQVDKRIEREFVAVALFDFTQIRLGIPSRFLPPTDSLRNMAKDFGPVMVDRVRGLDSLLRYYQLSPVRGEEEFRTITAAGTLSGDQPDDLRPLFNSALGRGRITAVDEVRYSVMSQMLSKGKLISSFVVDEWMKKAIHEGMLFASRSAFATIDSLTMDGYAINTVTLRDDS